MGFIIGIFAGIVLAVSGTVNSAHRVPNRCATFEKGNAPENVEFCKNWAQRTLGHGQ